MGEFTRVGGSRGYPSTEWFNLPVTKDIVLAPTPGAPDATAMAEFGQVNVPQSGTLSAIHLHQGADGLSGSTVLEVYRRRNGTMTQIATVTLVSGGGDFGFVNFSFVTIALSRVMRGDYLFLQATSKMGGSPAGFVDVHFSKTTL